MAAGIGALLLACADPGLPPDRLSYLGRWEGHGAVLEIHYDGRVRFTRVLADHHRRVTGTIRSFDGDDFIVGWPWWGMRFRVDRPPFVENGRWYIVVNALELERVSHLEEVIEI